MCVVRDSCPIIICLTYFILSCGPSDARKDAHNVDPSPRSVLLGECKVVCEDVEPHPPQLGRQEGGCLPVVEAILVLSSCR